MQPQLFSEAKSNVGLNQGVCSFFEYASLAMSTCILKALPGKLDIKRHSPSILYLLAKL